MTLISINKAPYEIMLDLIQEKWVQYIDDVEDVVFFMAGRQRINQFEPIPAIYSYPVLNITEQRGIPNFKATLDIITIKIDYYTENFDILFNVQQVLKDIIISNNKIQDTKQLSDSGIEWTSVVRFDFEYIYLDKETLQVRVSATVDVAYQDSYFNI